jgi:transcriptional regulator with XRE-family HTH domain
MTFLTLPKTSKPVVLRATKLTLVKISLRTIAGKLRRRRKELGLFQKELAVKLGVCEQEIINWENGWHEPMKKYYPIITEFLGYNPFIPDFPLNTIGDHVRRKRIERGLTQIQTADILGISEDTVADWEKGKTEPSDKRRKAVIEFLGYNPFLLEQEKPLITIGDHIRKRRLELSLTHAETAERLETNIDTAKSWQSGRTRPSKKRYGTITNFLGYKWEE